MQKIINVTITTKKETITTKEALDIGANYYFIKDKKVQVVRKNSDAVVTFDKVITDNDNSSYLHKKEVIFA